MNKGQLVEAIGKAADLSKKDAQAALEATLATIQKSLKKKDNVTLIGFGTFSVVKRKARTGINPATGEKIKIKAKNVVKFKAGSKLKASV
ncbi:MAG: DNA-binding protein [Chlamydiae bacterium]|nr:MAG: DNA-binding protein [Chlamydiota bacterium]